MIPLISKKYQYVYLFNPKSACSTYRNLFLELHRDELPEEVRASTTIHNVAFAFNPPPNIDYETCFIYTITRNPYSRLVSAYLDKCVELNTPPSQRYQIPDHQQWIFRPAFKFLGRAPDFGEGFSFLEFLEFLKFANERRRHVDLHFKPQVNPKLTLNAFYRIEDPVEQLIDIFQGIFHSDFDRLDLDRRVRECAENRMNTTFSDKQADVYKGTSLVDANFKTLSALHQDKHRLDYASFYDERSRSLVAQLFSADLENYGYTFPY